MHPERRPSTPRRSSPATVRLLLDQKLMKEGSRYRLLRLALTRHHRYRRYRGATIALTVLVLLAVPLTGLARVDLWGGAHYALGHGADFAVGFVAVSAAIAAFYGMTFLVNMFAGRMFCGFGCPVGQLSRFADVIDARANDPAPQRRAWVSLVAFAFLLCAATALWWVSPAVLLSGDLGAIALTGGCVLLSTAYAVFHARRWRWGFCRKVCPIGLYYSVVQTGALIGIDFDASAACIDCDACAGICPVSLDPRHLDQAMRSPGGLAFGGLPASAHCLHCGACVEICEHMMRKQPGPVAMAFRSPRHRRRVASTPENTPAGEDEPQDPERSSSAA